MKDNQKDYDEVVHSAAEYLKHKLQRTNGTLHDYNCLWRKVKYYIASQEIDSLSTTVCLDLLWNVYGKRDYCELSKRDYWGQPQLTWHLLISQIQFNSY